MELSHELDYIGWFFGEFATVYCVARNTGTLDIDVEDSVDAVLTRADGLTVNLHMDFLQRYPQRTCKIIGENGTIIWSLLDNKVVKYGPGRSVIELFEDSQYDWNTMYIDELKRFDMVAAGKLPPMVTFDDAYNTLKLIDALRQSASSQEVRRVSEPIS